MRRIAAVGFVLAIALFIGWSHRSSVEAPLQAEALTQQPPSTEALAETARYPFVAQSDATDAEDTDSPALGAARRRQEARLDDIARRVRAQRRRLADAGVSRDTLAAMDAHADRVQARRQRKP